MDSPEKLLDVFFDAFNRGDLAALLACYEPTAVLVAQPGAVAQGAGPIREALTQFLALSPRMTRERTQVIVAGDVALALTRWTLAGTGPDGSAVAMGGDASDVLRRAADGRWWVALDNPWGVALLGGAS